MDIKLVPDNSYVNDIVKWINPSFFFNTVMVFKYINKIRRKSIIGIVS